MELNKLQTRSLSTSLTLREGEDSRTIQGVAVVVNQETTLWEGSDYREIEVIDPSCINEQFIREQDIKCNMFHNRETTLARCNKGKGNLTIDTREDGLHFAFDAPTYDLGERALQMVREGVIDGCSFEFYPQDYEITEREGADGKMEYVIRHKAFRSLTAVTLALDPAYKQTSVNAREEYREAHPVTVPSASPEVPEVNQNTETTEERENIQSNIAKEMENNNNFAQELQELREQNNEIKKSLSDAVMKMAEREQAQGKSQNQLMREAIQAVRTHQSDGDFKLMREDSQKVIVSGKIGTDKNSMEVAGIPLTIKDLINPLEMGTIYGQLGLQVATGVRGNIQWPCLDTMAEVTVGGELDEAGEKTLDFSKITATPVKLGISISVSNEAINDEAFDLVGTITTQMNKAVGRVLNQRVLALTAPSAKAGFVGPLVSKKQTTTYTKTGATYKDIKAIKGLVLKTGAQMSGFCYIMDAAMYSTLEATPRDAGSGRFIIEGGKIDGDQVFITNLSAYAGKIVAGCFGYEALNQHGETHFIVDPYTQAKKNVTVFTLNGDWSLTCLLSDNETAYPFVVASAATA